MSKKQQTAGETAEPATRKARSPCDVIVVRVSEDGAMAEIGSGFVKPSVARAHTISRLEAGTLTSGRFLILTKRGELNATLTEIPAQKKLEIY